MVRIVIADDHPIFREGLKRLLELEDDFEVVGEAGDGRQALEAVQNLVPDVLLMDLRMPHMDGLSALQILNGLNQQIRVVILTASENKDDFVQAILLGCSGIVLKQRAPELVVRSIRHATSGEVWLDMHAAAVMHQSSTKLETTGSGPVTEEPLNPISKREREVVALVERGYRNKEIAEKLSI